MGPTGPLLHSATVIQTNDTVALHIRQRIYNKRTTNSDIYLPKLVIYNRIRQVHTTSILCLCFITVNAGHQKDWFVTVKRET